MSETETKEPTSVITLRLPIPVHQNAKLRAREAGTSLNQFCLDAVINAMVKPRGGDSQQTPAVPEVTDADCEIVAVGNYGDSVIFMGSQKFRIEHAALVKLPSAVDARAFGKRLLRLVGVRFIEK